MTATTEAPAGAAKQVVRQASRMLGAANPLEAGFAELLDETLQLPRGHHAYQAGGLPKAFDTRFSELSGQKLALGLEPGGPQADPAYRIARGTSVVQKLVTGEMGRDAARWLAARSEEARGSGYGATRWGAAISAAFDGNGLREAGVSYEWGPTLMDSLPAPLFRLAMAAIELMPGLRPAFSTVHVGRTTGSQQLTFAMEDALRLSELEPLMRELGLGHHHASLMSTCAFVLGARYVLPPGSALVTLRPTRGAGIELRLDVDLDRLPDVPEPLAPLLQMQMAERPRGLEQWRRWLAAFTADGYETPGRFSVLSIVVRRDLPARIALHLRPAVIDERPDDDDDDDDAGEGRRRMPAGWAGPESSQGL